MVTHVEWRSHVMGVDEMVAKYGVVVTLDAWLLRQPFGPVAYNVGFQT